MNRYQLFNFVRKCYNDDYLSDDKIVQKGERDGLIWIENRICENSTIKQAREVIEEYACKINERLECWDYSKEKHKYKFGFLNSLEKIISIWEEKK